MTQEDKELLIKDLCARLPFGVKFYPYSNSIMCIGHYTLNTITLDRFLNKDTEYGPPLDEVKPYLFPLSSMTEEQINDCPINETNLNIIKSNIGYGIIEMPWRLSYLFVDWCNKNHFDYRGLIEKGLALDATGKNIY